MESYFNQLTLYYHSLKNSLNDDGSREQAVLRLEICRFLLENIHDPQQEIQQYLSEIKLADFSAKIELFKAQMYYQSNKVGLAKQILKSSYKETVA